MNTDLLEQRPLQGIRVIDFTHVLAGPACAYYLGLLGADVIKLESVGRGDSIRHRGGSEPALGEHGMSTSYLTQGGGKRSLALNIADPEGRDVFEKLLRTADVFIENHRPETSARLRIDGEHTQAVNPRLVHCSMTGYGRGGPKSNHAAYDVNIQATCGIMSITGTQATGPVRPGAPIMDYGTGLAGALAVNSALLKRSVTGQGVCVDVSMLETALTLMASTVTDYLTTDNVPEPRGNAANSRSPGAGSFETKEGLISLAVNEESQFVALANALEEQDWLKDPRFRNRKTRRQYQSLLEAKLVVALAERTASEWETILCDAGVPCARVRTVPEILEHPHLAARQFIHTYNNEIQSGTQVSVPTLPFVIDKADRSPTSIPPTRGAHSVEILSELGFSREDINRLANSSVIEVEQSA